MKTRVCFLVAGLCLCALTTWAQEIESTLAGSSSAQGFTIYNNANTNLFTVRGTGHTGIGTNNPHFRLSLATDGGILAKGV